jgi:hypothetical protein
MFDMSDIEKAQRAAWRWYKQWRKRGCYSPVLKSEIRISEKGWRHIKGQAMGSKRNPHDMHYRFLILPLAEEVITTAAGYTTSHKAQGSFVILEKSIRGDVFRVVLIDDARVGLIFLSIMRKS